MFRKQHALVLVACTAVVATSCRKSEGPEPASKSAVVARVGDRVVTQDYFEQRLAKMERRFLPDTLDLAGKRKFLDFIINKELMAMKAEELKYGDDPRVVNAMKMYEDNLAGNAAIDALTKGKLDVTDAQITEFFDKKRHKVIVKHILLRSEHEAAELRKKLTIANFDSMASIYSVVPRKDVNTGEDLPLSQRVLFGEVQYGDTIIPVEDAVFSTPLNQISQPTETGYGWHLFIP